MAELQLTTRRLLELMQHLQQLANQRAAEESRITDTHAEQLTAAEKDHTLTANRLTKQFTQARRKLENEFSAAKLSAAQEHRATKQEIDGKHEAETNRLEQEDKQRQLAIERKYKEKQWEAMAVFDATKDTPQQMLDEAGKRILTRKAQTDALLRDADTLIAMRKLTGHVESANLETDASQELAPTDKPAEEVQQKALAELHHAVLDLQAQKLPSLLFEESRMILWGVLATLIAVVPVLLLTQFSFLITTLVAPVIGALITATVYLVLGPRARQASLQQYGKIRSHVAICRQLEVLARQEAKERSRQEAAAIELRKQQELAAAQEYRALAQADSEAKRQELQDQAQQKYARELAATEDRYAATQAAIENKYPAQLDALATQREQSWQENEGLFAKRTVTAEQEYATAWTAMADRWLTGFRAVAEELAEMRAACDRYFPDWSKTQWQDWERPAAIPPVFKFGTCLLPLQAVKHGISQDPRLVPEPTQLELPAWMSLSESPRLMVVTDGTAKGGEGASILQLMMLRFLTALPAGKLRFTIIDPAQLGESFASFMHLADYDEQLVGKRIWTDSRHIDERLSLLADHMEKVLQKYLRNEFATIEEYNAQAGEVAEPYHMVVVANFPAGLSDTSMRKLQTIATTGPRCGVYTIMSIDSSLKLPAEFDLKEMLHHAVHLQYSDQRFKWRYPLFEKLSLEVDQLPAKDKFNAILRHAGEESRSASKVEVPFSVVAPSPKQFWAGDTSSELVVPVGRAGANELQSLRLGRGTAQHALISGKTGSGKSTLLHALVTNLALHYSPEEVEFYLVDFKKGVEFKTYATHELPHARVIAIESEREFGVSVLERLDDELRQRGERFRSLGAQDLASFRSAAGERLPRILLIIDEFQELFVADDKLAQDAALLLDRLVRQGRAFGIHVLLGSQTLAGAYSLARSTIGQMAVRIALECSEADAHLILSDDNPAARLLSRPGEAIYNDQNGLVDGNHLFQVVWLPERERQTYLREIQQRAIAENIVVEPAIVFEGNVPAQPLHNEQLVSLFANGAHQNVVEPTVWLGSAVRIEPPTQMTFRRQGGNHLIIVGQDEPLALGILTTAAAAIAAQLPDGTAPITVLDGTRAESPDSGTWKRLAEVLPERLNVLPLRATNEVITKWAAEVKRRSEQPDEHHEPHFLVVYDLAQFRDLRITEEEFSFSVSRSENNNPPATDKQFREILKEGPAVGVHVLIWSDSHNSLSRVLDRIAMREIDYRVALQMSPVDSTSLIDTPAAGRLGEHRAIFYRDDLGTSVKFRPYGRPSQEWLTWLTEHETQVKNDSIRSPAT